MLNVCWCVRSVSSSDAYDGSNARFYSNDSEGKEEEGGSNVRTACWEGSGASVVGVTHAYGACSEGACHSVQQAFGLGAQGGGVCPLPVRKRWNMSQRRRQDRKGKEEVLLLTKQICARSSNPPREKVPTNIQSHFFSPTLHFPFIIIWLLLCEFRCINSSSSPLASSSLHGNKKKDVRRPTYPTYATRLYARG